MPIDKAPDNDRTDYVLVTHADGTTEDIYTPEEDTSSKTISLSQETIDALGAAFAKAMKQR
jgi:hypothetical protein